MRTLAWRGVRNNLGRYIATLVAIITGVGFFTATGFISDRVISSLEGDVDQQYANVDAAVVLKDDSTDNLSGNPGKDLKISGSQTEKIRTVPGVEGSAGILTAPVAFPGNDPGLPGGEIGFGEVLERQKQPIHPGAGRRHAGPRSRRAHGPRRSRPP